ncbi:MAG: M3 family metallopeptidase [Solirubrobacteraceae bacterium]
MQNNLLVKEFSTPFKSAPFSKINNQDFIPAIEKLIQESETQIKAIEENLQLPTFSNTIEALEKIGLQLDRVTSILFNLNSAQTNEEIQEITQNASKILTKFSSDVSLNTVIFNKVKSVYGTLDNLILDEEQKILLEKTYKGFKRNGADLQEDKKNRLREIDLKLSQLGLIFGKNVLDETNRFFIQIEEEKELVGLPSYAIEAAKEEANQRELKGWVFTLQIPSYLPFMKFSANRELREKMSIAFGSKAFYNNEKDNQQNILEIVGLKKERANLLGYNSYAQFVLEERMVKEPAAVFSFLEELLQKSLPAAKKEIEELKAIGLEEGILDIKSWDHAYLSEKLKEKKLAFSDEQIKPYFKLENVLNGAFEIANRLFGISFIERKDIEVYHSDVWVYEVLDENKEHLSLLYTDFFPRKEKRAGAWMTSFKNQSNYGLNTSERPHISIVCNFTKPTESNPSLLTFDEVTTLFHEFGHALHGMLANTKYKSLSGTSVLWDFVELPSQFMENFCYEKEALSLFAKHYQTAEVLPEELIEKIIISKKFMSGYQTLRQISFSMLDMAWYNSDISLVKNVSEFEQEVLQPTQLYPFVEGTNMSCSFSHIFQGGYAAGYYSYKWAEVLDADAFEAFKEKGIFNKEIAIKFKDTILSMGGTRQPMDLYLAFRGKKPNVTPLLKRAGLIN